MRHHFLKQYPLISSRSDTPLPERLAHIPLELVPSKRARRLALRLDVRDRRFKLIQPMGVSKQKAYAFALSHLSWMEEKIKLIPAPVPFAHGSILPLFEKDHTIETQYAADRKRTEISIETSRILMLTNKCTPQEQSARLERFLKQYAKQELARLSYIKADIISKKINKISIREMSTRWGSCSPTSNISYNWRLIFAPFYVTDYIVAHEVAHLKHLDHSSAFWHVCRHLSEDYIGGKSWIKSHGHTLLRYGS